MNIVELYSGPTKEFEKIIEPCDQVLSLHTLITTIDKENFNDWINDNSGRNYTLVCYSEDLSSVKEHFLGMLPNLIRLLVEKECIIECYIHNPPLLLKEGIIRLFENDEYILVKENTFEFNKITTQDITNLYEELNKEIIGQEQPILELVSTIYPLTAKYSNPVVLLFYGPAGVGKTETAKLLSKVLYNGKLLREQISMYQTEAFASYLFGGSINKNSFAKGLIGRETNVILLDEFDKCPPGFFSAFYQFFDEGLFVDRNYKVNLKNSIIICTTNYGSLEEIKKQLGSPIFSRFDGFISFGDLSQEDKLKLIRIKYEKNLSLWDEEQQALIKKKNAIDFLTEHANKFINARNIDNGIRSYMSKLLIQDVLNRNT
jgi:ATP-dependent Clp protease ATP-binding subunit ClpA